MDQEFAGMAERLVTEFPDIPAQQVMATVCRCSDECDHASSYFVEAAARATLLHP
ncbi:MAG: hypothetical protein HOQ22_15000 [Nocardioidaceae bacterium]|nr:hypothetical protein [Nocardioidaceae bacterium]NUS52335.1 hypothetical protein [Nocardioidaceae bacterium]